MGGDGSREFKPDHDEDASASSKMKVVRDASKDLKRKAIVAAPPVAKMAKPSKEPHFFWWMEFMVMFEDQLCNYPLTSFEALGIAPQPLFHCHQSLIDQFLHQRQPTLLDHNLYQKLAFQICVGADLREDSVSPEKQRYIARLLLMFQKLFNKKQTRGEGHQMQNDMIHGEREQQRMNYQRQTGFSMAALLG
ncbi:uncharacterized protein [Triticum aestivum]|uniref:uncharacterized protein isoform X1 n=1 Tax=Triticum aestivum TaxID=4565 RepID=UPI001D021357|nr:uncharacterized protein LOC123111245 isoform X1 [Triticum aestivum]